MNVAFLITVYKYDNLEYFKESINSIIYQDIGFENINIYLGIDGELSQDIAEYIDTNKSIFYKIITNDINNGLAFTLNKLINILEEEEYIFRMDSDDICMTNRVSKQISFMEQNHNKLICGGAIEEIDELKQTVMVRTYPKSTKEAKKLIIKATIFAHPTVCFRKSFFKRGFKYNEKYKYSQDLALWHEALLNNIEVGNIDDIVLKFRITNDFYQRRNKEKALQEFLIYQKHIIKLHGVNWRLIYPIVRLTIRLMPVSIIKILYNKRFRKFLNT